MRLKFWCKKDLSQEIFESDYRENLHLELKQNRHEVQFRETAWQLEKKRTPGEYIR